MNARSRQARHSLEEKALNYINNKVESCFDKADVVFNNRFRRAVCNLKQRGRAAGTAHLQKNELRFNVYMYQQNPSEFIDTVVPHEVAHLIVYQIYGNTVKPHGKEWQAVMIKIYGLRPNRTHTFDTPPQKNAYEYQCSCQKHQFSKQRHSRAQKGTEYVCKGCKSTLQFVDKSK